ncbi:MAG: sucrose phosphorylase [Clostridiales bacterium]|jgi:sucrose phosphorylase|nr:sucrose phosphorylase [Clostridiales bacterium]
MKNQIMLITYPNSLGQNLKELNDVLTHYLRAQIGGVHILPFYPSSADRGFAPMTYQEVDSAYGTFEDIRQIAASFDVMADFMINHISKSSIYFQDFLENKEKSPYDDLFIKISEFFGKNGPSETEIGRIYKRKPKAPFQEITFTDGSKDQVWTTFDDEQIDIDIRKEATRAFVKENLTFLCKQGVKCIRADAFAYVTKKRGTSCFFVEPETWEVLEFCKTILEPYGVALLPEIHEHYSIQQKIESAGYYAYDFALPMLVLHALYSGEKRRLVHWLNIAPRNQFTTLDTHDGIGVVDVADLLTQEEIEFTQDALFAKGANVKRIYNTTTYHNLDIYQINCTYYSALGDRDDAYLAARAIQFFAPGIPQVYYVGLLAGKNDIQRLEETKNGREINRHNYTLIEIEEEVRRPVVKKLFSLMAFRNRCKAFDGVLTVEEDGPAHLIKMIWENGTEAARLTVDLNTYAIEIEADSGEGWKTIEL